MKYEHGKISILDPRENLEILERNYYGHLGCTDSDQAYVTPVTYAMEDGYIYSHSKPGHKISLMRDHPKVCLQVEEIQNLFNWKSVLINGIFEELNDIQSAMGMRLLIKRITSLVSQPKFSNIEIDTDAIFASAIVYRIKIENISGRFEGAN